MADPGAATKIARRVGPDLPALLERPVGRPLESWRVASAARGAAEAVAAAGLSPTAA